LKRLLTDVWFTDHLSSFLSPQDKAADLFYRMGSLSYRKTIKPSVSGIAGNDKINAG
jgi:hypothetical protein